MRGMEVKGGDDPKKQYVEFEDNSDEWNLALDKELTTAMLKNYYEQVPQKYWPAFFKNTGLDGDLQRAILTNDLVVHKDDVVHGDSGGILLYSLHVFDHELLALRGRGVCRTARDA